MPLTPERLALFVEIEQEAHQAANDLLTRYRHVWDRELGIEPYVYGTVISSQQMALRDFQVTGLGGRPAECLRCTGLDDVEIYYAGDEYWSYGGHESHTYSLPTRYLFEEWEPHLAEAIRKAVADRDDRIAQAAAQAQEKERKLLADLKLKYPEASISAVDAG